MWKTEGIDNTAHQSKFFYENKVNIGENKKVYEK
jgi:hypothetical protein